MNKHYKEIELTQGTPEWKAYRNLGVGASDIPAIMELPGAYQTRDQLLNTKITGKGIETNTYLEQVFQDGHAWEAIFRDSLNRDQGFNFVPMVIESLYHPKFFASLDGICDRTNQILEVKSTKRDDFLQPLKHKIVPAIWMAQIQWQLYISNISNALLCVVNTIDQSHTVIRVHREKEYIDQLIAAANRFLTDLESGLNPIKIIPVEPEVFGIIALKDIISSLNESLEKAKNQIDERASKLLEKHSARKLSCGVLDIQEVTRAGSIQYQNIPELQGVNLDYYRKPDSKYVTVKIKQVKQQTKLGENENE